MFKCPTHWTTNDEPGFKCLTFIYCTTPSGIETVVVTTLPDLPANDTATHCSLALTKSPIKAHSSKSAGGWFEASLLIQPTHPPQKKS